MEFKDYYQILGVPRDAGADDIKKAYRKLARRYHPDVSKEADASARMAEVNEANTVLSDPEKRAAYDRLGQEAAHHGRAQDFRPPPNWDAGFEYSGAPGPDSMDGAEFSDFFEQLFGRAARAQRAQRRGGAQARGAPPPQQRGRDHHAVHRAGSARRLPRRRAARWPCTARTWTRPGAWSTKSGSCRSPSPRACARAS